MVGGRKRGAPKSHTSVRMVKCSKRIQPCQKSCRGLWPGTVRLYKPLPRRNLQLFNPDVNGEFGRDKGRLLRKRDRDMQSQATVGMGLYPQLFRKVPQLGRYERLRACQ